ESPDEAASRTPRPMVAIRTSLVSAENWRAASTQSPAYWLLTLSLACCLAQEHSSKIAGRSAASTHAALPLSCCQSHRFLKKTKIASGKRVIAGGRLVTSHPSIAVVSL